MRKLQAICFGFVCDDRGSEAIEYALVISLVVISLVLAFSSSTGLLSAFTALFTLVAGCIGTGSATC